MTRTLVATRAVGLAAILMLVLMLEAGAAVAQEAAPAGCGDLDALYHGIMTKNGLPILNTGVETSNEIYAAAVRVGIDLFEAQFAGIYAYFDEDKRKLAALRKIHDHLLDTLHASGEFEVIGASEPGQFGPGAKAIESSMICLNSFASQVDKMITDLDAAQNERQPGLNSLMARICARAAEGAARTAAKTAGLTMHLEMVGSPERDKTDWGRAWPTIGPGNIEEKLPNGSVASFAWDALPQSIDLAGTTVELDVDATATANDRLSAGITMNGGFDFDPNPAHAEVLSESAKSQHKHMVVRVIPPQQLTPDVILFLHVGADYGPSITYRYRAVP
jgi:hypothetical protein